MSPSAPLTVVGLPVFNTSKIFSPSFHKMLKGWQIPLSPRSLNPALPHESSSPPWRLGPMPLWLLMVQMDWRAFMSPEQSTSLITAHIGLTSNSFIIFNEWESASAWQVGVTKWLPSSNKICTLWLLYASKMLQRLKCCVSPDWWYYVSSHQFHSYLHRIQWKFMKSEPLMSK